MRRARQRQEQILEELAVKKSAADDGRDDMLSDKEESKDVMSSPNNLSQDRIDNKVKLPSL